MKMIIRVNAEYNLRRGLNTEIVLMHAFIEQQNYQMENYINNFPGGLNRSNNIVEAYDGEIVSVSNIRNCEYDLDITFKSDFPNYIRKSQLLMLWAMLEDTLKFIVNKLSTLNGVSIRQKKKGESIFIHLIKQLEIIDGNRGDIVRSVDFLNNNVRFVRNSLVHGSKLKNSYPEVIENEHGLIISDKYIYEVCSAIHHIGDNL